MVFMENMGDNDFRSLYRSVDEQLKEEEERQQAEMFLRLLDDLDARETTPSNISSSPGDSSADEDSDDEYMLISPRKRKKKQKNKRVGRLPRHNKEYLKVSIVDDERTRRENATNKDEKEKRQFHGKVHTLDDLPADDLDFYKIFGGAPPEEPAEVNIEAGRRLKDGKIFYSAKFPNNIFEGIDIGAFSLELEYIVIFILVVFLIGVFIGKLASRRNHNKAIQQLKRSHTAQLQSIQQSLLAYQYSHHTPAIQSQPLAQHQPVYVTVPASPAPPSSSQPTVSSTPATTT